MINCNLIISTCNRPNYLQRILDYYHQYGSDFKIIVADSSSDENKALNKEIISSFKNLKILYLANHPDTIKKFYYRSADAINYVKSKYCVFCADDDFATPKGIKKSVEFLEKNPDFAIAQGEYISFDLKDNKRKKRKQFYWVLSPYQSITFSDAKSRLAFHLSNYEVTTFCAVHRTDFAKMIYKELLDSKVEPLLFGELLLSMLTLIYGKMKRLDILYMAREAFTPRSSRYPALRDFKRKGKYDAEYEKFRNCLALHLSKKSQLDIDKVKKVVDNAMAVYLRKNWPWGIKHFLIDRIKDIFNFLNLPYSLYEKMRITYSKLVNKSLSSKNNLPAKYYNDFNKIKDCVISHAKIKI